MKRGRILGQVSLEYLMVAAFILVLISIIFFPMSNSIFQSINSAKARNASDTIAAGVNQVYALGPGSRATIYVDLPENVERYILNETEVGFVLNVDGQEAHVYSDTKVRIDGELPIDTGWQTINLSVNENGTVSIGAIAVSKTPVLNFIDLNVSSVGQGESILVTGDGRDPDGNVLNFYCATTSNPSSINKNFCEKTGITDPYNDISCVGQSPGFGSGTQTIYCILDDTEFQSSIRSDSYTLVGPFIPAVYFKIRDCEDGIKEYLWCSENTYSASTNELGINGELDKNGLYEGFALDPESDTYQSALSSNIFGLWHLDEESGTTYEDSAQNNEGTCSAPGCPTAVEGLFESNAQYFDGIDDQIRVTREIDANFSWGFWMKTTQTGPGTVGDNWTVGNGIVDGYFNGTDDYGISLVADRIAFGTEAPDHTIYSTTVINDGNWHHVVATREITGATATLNLYIDGVLEATDPGSTNKILDRPADISFGSLQNNTNYYEGLIEEIMVTKYVFTQDDVIFMYDSQVPKELDTNFVLYFKYNEGSGTNVYDYAGGDNNGTLDPGLNFSDGLWDTYGLLTDGTDKKIIVDDSPNLNISDSITLATWVNGSGNTQYVSDIYSAEFGDGADGNVTISANTTLVSDINYENLTVNEGITLDTAGYVVRVSGTLTNNGTITDAQSGATGGAGGNGGLGNVGDGDGGNGSAGSTGSVGVGGAGSGGTGGGGAGGGAGQSDSGNVVTGGDGGQGGTGGQGGGIVTIYANEVINNSVIHANGFQGGTGGTGGNGEIIVYANKNVLSGAGGGGGGGNGGDGGTLTLYYRTLTAQGTVTANGGLAGNGGLGGNGVTAQKNQPRGVEYAGGLGATNGGDGGAGSEDNSPSGDGTDGTVGTIGSTGTTTLTPLLIGAIPEYGSLISKAGYGLLLDGNIVRGEINDSNINYPIGGGWNFVVMTYDSAAASNQQKLYINGSNVANATLTETINSDNNSLVVGKYLDGKMDETFIFKKALSPTEILNIYNNSFKGKFYGVDIDTELTDANWQAVKIIGNRNSATSCVDLEYGVSNSQPVTLTNTLNCVPLGTLVSLGNVTGRYLDYEVTLRNTVSGNVHPQPYSPYVTDLNFLYSD